MEKPKSWVYFIQQGDDGPIKIGFTASSPKSRMSTLQTGNPIPLRMIAATPGSQQDEQDLHKRFAALRMSGEWFQATADLLGFVRGIAWAARDIAPPDEEEDGLTPEQAAAVYAVVDGYLDGRGKTFTREDVALIHGFGKIADAVSNAVDLAEQLRGRDALDVDDLARVAELRSALAAPHGDAASLYGAEAIKSADDALAEIESIHGCAVSYLRALEGVACGENPVEWRLDTTDIGPLSDNTKREWN